MSLQLPADVVHVWYLATSGWTPSRHAEAVACLDAAERARHDRFRVPEDRRDFAAAHELLRRVLSHYVDCTPDAWRFEPDAFGKPSLVAPRLSWPLQFNISHTRGHVACAVARGAAVGVDVETVDDACDHMALAFRYFGASEIDALASCSRERRAALFTSLWTLKEAYLKGVGVGLSAPLTAFRFEVDADGVRFHAPDPRDAEGWQFAVYEIAKARLAVAVGAPVATQPRAILIRHETVTAETAKRAESS